MTSWLTWEEFSAAHPEQLTEAEYTSLAAQAAMTIRYYTRYRADIAEDEESVAVLKSCQESLVLSGKSRADADNRSGAGAVASASNDGYSETYVSRMDLFNIRETEDKLTIAKMLGGPQTRWMLYTGGVYHAPARRYPTCR